jgi:hypothetical protein
LSLDRKTHLQIIGEQDTKAMKEESSWIQTNREARAQTETPPGRNPVKFPPELFV